MDVIRRHACRLAIFSVIVALSVGIVFAENSGTHTAVNVPSKDVIITDVSYIGEDQWVTILNEGITPVDLTGWTLMNKAGTAYPFPAKFNLKAGSIIKVHTENGFDAATDLYYRNLDSDFVWGLRSDTATLKDSSQNIVSEYTYPAMIRPS